MKDKKFVVYEDLGLSHATLEKQIKNEKTRSNFHWEVL